MEKGLPKIRFFLREADRTLTRNYSNKTRVWGTRQLECYVSFGKRIIEELPNGMKWKPEGKHTGSAVLGWAGAAMSNEEKSRLTNVKHRLGKLRIDVNGNLVEYLELKFQTGLFLLPASWSSQEQVATAPYEAINSELVKIKHIVSNTYNELIQRADFSKETFLAEIKQRLKNGMPLTVVIPDTTSTVQTIKHVAKALAHVEGLDLPDELNPKGVPDDLREYILWYSTNKLDPKKLSEETVKSREELSNKLQRYFVQTKMTLSVTKSKISDISDFLKWRIYDNEENKARKGKNNIVNGTHGDAIGMGTYNKCKHLLKFFYNSAVNEFECKIQFSTKHKILIEEAYDREMNDAYLSMDQLNDMFKIDLKGNEGLNRHRSLFIMGCLGGGYRISDLVKLPQPTLQLFNDGHEYYCFDVVSKKTKTPTKVPIPEELNPIIESYDFNLPIVKEKFRKDIKTIGQMLGWDNIYTYYELLADGKSKKIEKPFWDMLIPKTCRKSFCSLLYNFYDCPIEECMDFSGHATEQEFLKYLNIDKKAKAQKLVNRFKAKPIFR